MTYGIDIALRDDALVAVAEKAMDSLSPAVVPGAFLVDVIPAREHSIHYTTPHFSILTTRCAVKYVPSWMPGAGFKRKALLWSEDPKALVETAYGRVKRDMVSNCHSVGMVSSCIYTASRTVGSHVPALSQMPSQRIITMKVLRNCLQ